MSPLAGPRDPSHGTGGSSTAHPRTPSPLLVSSAGPAAGTASCMPHARSSSGTRSGHTQGLLSEYPVLAVNTPTSELRDLHRLRSSHLAKPCPHRPAHDRCVPRLVPLRSHGTASGGSDQVTRPPPCSDIRSAKPVSTAPADSVACFLPLREAASPPLPGTSPSLPSEPSPLTFPPTLSAVT